MEYSAQLRCIDWRVKRKQILKRDNYTCHVCRIRDTLGMQVHHLKYGNKNAWAVPHWWLIAVCEPCHRYLHSQRDKGFSVYATSQLKEAIYQEIKNTDGIAEIADFSDEILARFNGTIWIPNIDQIAEKEL